jgi:plastocyanin
MGIPPASAQAFNDNALDINDFFPHGITVNAGDSVKFIPVGFHTADIAPKGGAALPFISPTGDKVSGVNDAAGQPFWFNGQDAVSFNPTLVTTAGFGKKFSYNGTKRVESGAPIAPVNKPMVVKFTKKGSFTYFCDIHPGMKGTVKVVGKKAKAPTAKADAKVVKNQLKADATVGKELSKKTPPANTVDVGSAGRYGVEYFGYLPKVLTVPVHTPVTFQMTPDSFEDHTATTSAANADPENPANASTPLGQIAASFFSTQFDPRGVWTSDPTEPASLTKASHGDGFWNSGVLAPPARNPFPTLIASRRTVTFDQAGVYDFWCMVHPQMHGQVIVQ